MRKKKNRIARLHRLPAISSTGPAEAPVKFAVTRKIAPTKTQAMAADKRASPFSGRPLWPRAARLIYHGVAVTAYAPNQSAETHLR